MENSIRAVIVDDEQLAVDLLTAYLEPFPEITVAAAYTRSSEAVAGILRMQPELLFLDINMPGLDGFQLLEAITAVYQPYIIFTTAFDQYAVQAFEVNATGYLLKPIDRQKLRAVIDRYLAVRKQQPGQGMYEALLHMLRSREKEPQYLEQLMVKNAQKIIFVPAEELIYIEASGDYVTLVTATGRHLLSTSLAALESQLNPDQFIRIHRSCLLNAKQVKEFIPYFNGEYKIVMSNHDTLKMSRNYKSNVQRVFNGL